MIDFSEEDIFNIKNNNSIVILQSNVLGFGATGLFKRLRLEFPSLFDEYHNYSILFKDKKYQNEAIGHFVAYEFPESTNRICFAFAQKYITETKFFIEFEAWEKIIKNIIRLTLKNEEDTGVLYEMHIPYKIGSGMKPEEVEKVRDMLDKAFKKSKIKLVYHM